MSYLPYQDTTVSVAKSMAKTIEALEEIGFTKIAQISDDGRRYVVAEHKGATFTFEANIDNIKSVLQSHKQYRIPDLQEKAERVAWRILFNRVKSSVDSLKYQVEELAEVFGGHLSFNQDGQQLYLANVIAEQIENGNLQSNGFPGMPRLSAPESRHET